MKRKQTDQKRTDHEVTFDAKYAHRRSELLVQDAVPWRRGKRKHFELTNATRLRIAFPPGPMGGTRVVARQYQCSPTAVTKTRQGMAALVLEKQKWAWTTFQDKFGYLFAIATCLEYSDSLSAVLARCARTVLCAQFLVFTSMPQLTRNAKVNKEKWDDTSQTMTTFTDKKYLGARGSSVQAVQVQPRRGKLLNAAAKAMRYVRKRARGPKRSTKHQIGTKLLNYSCLTNHFLISSNLCIY